MSITATRLGGSLVPLKATPCLSQALYLFVQRVHFAIVPRFLRFWRIGAAQPVDGLTNGEFIYFSHRKTLGLGTGYRTCGSLTDANELNAPIYCLVNESKQRWLETGERAKSESIQWPPQGRLAATPKGTALVVEELPD